MKALFLSGANILVFVSMSISVTCAQPGSLDITFNPGSGANLAIYCIALQTNAQIIIGGDFTTYNGANRTRLARLNANGSLDSSFDPGVGPDSTGPGSSGSALALQQDGKILIGGGFTSFNGVGYNRLVRLRPDGVHLDTVLNI